MAALRLSEHVILARVGARAAGEAPAAPRGVLVRLDTPVAAFVSPAVWRWLAGDGAAAEGLPEQARAACVAAWRQAGLIDAGDTGEPAVPADGRRGDLDADGARIAGTLPGPVLAVGVSAACSFCAQLEADLAANIEVLRRARFGVLLAGDGSTRSFGLVPGHAAAGLARLAVRAAESGTPGGVLVAPGRTPAGVLGYDQVTAALVRMSQWGRDVVVEPPTSCSVNVMGGGGAVVHPVVAGDRVAGVGLRGHASQDLAAYVAGRSAGAGYAPPVLLVERPQNLFLVFRGGELIARLKAAADVEGLLDTVLDGYATVAAPPPTGPAGAAVLCGALLATRGDGAAEAVLFPRSWMSDLVKQQSRLRRAGWTVCPDPYVPLTGTSPGPGTDSGAGPGAGTGGAGRAAGTGRLLARVHPRPAGSPGRWPAWTGPVREILLDPEQATGGRAVSTAQLLAQVVNWVARPATAGQVHALAAAVTDVPVRAITCGDLIGELTSAHAAVAARPRTAVPGT